MNKKVLFVASTMEHIENFHMPYIEGLKKNGIEVFVMATGKGHSGIEPDFDIPFQKKISSFKNFKLVSKIKKILKNNNFDVIILNTTLAAFFVRLAVKKLNVKPKVINIAHGYLFSKQTGKLKTFMMLSAEKFVKNVTDEILVMNNEDFEIANKNKLCKGEIYKINGMGINGDNRVLNSKDNAKSKSNDDKVKFTFIGELSGRKNQNFLIEFIDKLSKSGVNAYLDLVGTGSKEQEFKELANSLGVNERINFVGYDKNIMKYLLTTDYYISASKIEGLPFNILEAMAAGCVVISANVKGCNDLIINEESGILYEFNNMENLLMQFNKIHSNEKLKEKIRKNAVKYAQQYELNSVYDDNMRILTKLINEK